MAAIDWDDVTAHAAELSSIATIAQDDILAYVSDVHDVSVFVDGEDDVALRLARIYLAAHLGSLTPSSTAGGLVKSSSAGGLSRSYGPFASADGLKSTIYGLRYLDIIEGTPARAPVII
jgi:hypothetical protein